MNIEKIKAEIQVENFFQPREPLHVGTFKIIKYLIIYNYILPGERLVFNQLTELLKISRVPLKEAIQLLVARGFVVCLPNNGTYAIKLDQDYVNEICDIRLMIESYALRISCNNIPKDKLQNWLKIFESEESMVKGMVRPIETPRNIKQADAELHNSFVYYSDRPLLLDIYSRIEDFLMLIRHISKRLVISSKEHIDLIQAIMVDDCEKASEILVQHLKSVKESTFLES